MNRPGKILLSILSLFLLILLLAVAVALFYQRGDRYHPASQERLAVWAAQRIVAEAAGLAVAVWDPYRKNLKTAGLHPESSGPESHAGNFVSDSAGLQRLLDSRSEFNGAVVRCYSSDSLPSGRFAFNYQTWAEPRLDSLAGHYNLAGVFGEESEDYAGFLKLNRWLHDYMSQGEPRITQFPEVDYNFDALDILKRAGLGERFWCSEYSTTLVQCLAALGYSARYVMLNSNNGGHVLCEAWSDSYGKWVMLDPFYSRIVLLEGIPLNVEEIHSLLADPDEYIKAVVRQSGQVLESAGQRDFYFNLFRQFAVRMRNDWFSNRFPHWYPLSNSVLNAVEWQDSLTLDNIKYKNESRRLEDLYWPLNRVRISVSMAEIAQLEIRLETCTPNFEHFLADSGGNVACEIPAGLLSWKLEPGTNRLSVAAVNHWGIQGKPARLEIDCPSAPVN